METTQEAVDKLAALVDIPNYLLEHGYRGVRYSSCACPVAAYLQDKTGITHIVSPTGIIVVREEEPREIVSVPQPIIDFLDQFDRGDFSSLIITEGVPS